MRTYLEPIEAWNYTRNDSSCLPTDLKSNNAWDFYKDVLICFLLSLTIVNRSRLGKVKNKMMSIMFSLTCILVGLLLAPIFFAFLVLLWSFKEVVRNIVLAMNSHNCYVIDLMQGTDMFWATDDSVSRSVINILALVDFGSLENLDNEPLQTVRELMKKVTQGNQTRYWKMSCFKKMSDFGYYYWEKQDGLKIEDHVKWMTVDRDEMTVGGINEFITSVVNDSLPNNDQSLWEIFVGKYPVRNQVSRDGSKVFPVVFRVHHSLGDGPSLIRLLVESLGKDESRGHRLPTLIPPLDKDAKAAKPVLFARMNKRDIGNYFFSKAYNMIQKMSVLIFATESMVRQKLITSDHNDLHGRTLSGEKITSFFVEKVTDPSNSLLVKMKRLKNKLGCHFSDVLFTAISEALENHFGSKTAVPKDVAVILPTRLPDEDRKSAVIFESRFKTEQTNARVTKIVKFKNEGTLNNRFSVGVLHLPVASQAKSGILDKLERVKERTRVLRNSVDHVLNHWLLNNMLACMPTTLMKKAMCGMNCTLVVSNLPGPQTQEKLGQHKIQDLVFWVPNKGNTGIGLTVLSYAGHLNMGIIADTALIWRQEELNSILHKIVTAIDRLEEAV